MFVEHERQSIRLPGHDYAGSGAYFVTICTHERAHIFGSIKNGEMRLNAVGEIVADEWMKTASMRPYVKLDEWVVMPNHVHGIIWIIDRVRSDSGRGVLQYAPTINETKFRSPSIGIGAIIRGFKSAVTKRIREIKPEWPRIWQRNYYERVIRDDRELFATREYIRQNPKNWERDEYK